MELVVMVIDLAPWFSLRPALDEDLALASLSPYALSIGPYRSSIGVAPDVVRDFHEFATCCARR